MSDTVTVLAADSAGVISLLSRRRWMKHILAIAGLLAGVPLCFLAPLFLGSLFWFSTGMLNVWYPWLWFILGASAVVIPLLLRLEIQTAGDFLGHAVQSWNFGDDERLAWTAAAIGAGGVYGAGIPGMRVDPRGATAGLMEFFLLGPRLALSGFRHLVGTVRVRIPSLDIPANVVVLLLGHEKGVPVKLILRQFEDGHSLAKGLRWLTFYQWIGVGENGEKVFLFTDERESLAKAVAR